MELELKIQNYSPNSYRVYFLIQNRRSFLDLLDLKLLFSIGTNLSPVAEIFDFVIPFSQIPSIRPLTSIEYDITFCLAELISEYLKRPVIVPRSNNEQFVTLKEVWMNSSIRTTRESEGIPIDHQVALKTHFHPLLFNVIQSYLPKDAMMLLFENPPVMKMKSVSLDHILKVEWPNGNRVIFGRECGRLLSWSIHGHEVITNPIELCLWRAPTDNDRSDIIFFVISCSLLEVGHFYPIINNGKHMVSTVCVQKKQN